VSGIVRVILGVTCVVWFVIEVRQSRHVRRDATAADRGSRILVQLAAVGGVLAGLAVTRLTSGDPIASGGAAVWIAFAVLWAGIGLRLWCFRTLGRYFTFTVATSTDQQVISSGPYRVLRHPSYTAILLAVTGLGLFYVSWLGLLVLLVCVLAGLAYRIKVEERALVGALGDRYRDYAATRRQIVPFIW